MAIGLAFGILVAATLLFISGRLRPDLVALLVMIALGATGIITQQEALSGFSSSAVILILAAFVITEAINRTGLGNRLGAFLLRASAQSERRLLLALSASAAFLSLFMNNIAAAAVLMPSAMVAMRKVKASPTRLLLPLAFATQLAGMATLLTTSNVVMASILREQGLPSFGLLDFLPIGGPIAVLGLGMMVLLAPRLLPATSESALSFEEEKQRVSLIELYELSRGLAVARILPGSPLVGRTLATSGLRQNAGLNVIAILHNSGQIVRMPSPGEQLHANDRLLFSSACPEAKLKALGLEAQPPDGWGEQLTGERTGLAEALITPRSSLADKTLRQVRFRDRYGLNVLSIWRNGRPIREGLEDLPLRFGDALLLQGPRSGIRLLENGSDLIVLGEEVAEWQQHGREWTALAIIVVTLALAATNRLPVAEVLFLGAVLLLLTQCLTMEEAYAAIDWRSVFLIGGMLPMGIALNKTGAAAELAGFLVNALGHFGPLVLLAGFFGFTVVLTQLIPGGAATPLVVGPIAISAAQHVGADPRAFAMAVALAVSTSFLTPFAHPVNVLVMGPGGYRFRDYVRLGLPLVALTFSLVMVLLPRLYPL